MNRKAIPEPKYLIFDGRYRYDPDRATLLLACETLEEAKRHHKDWGDAVIVDAKTGEVVQ